MTNELGDEERFATTRSLIRTDAQRLKERMGSNRGLAYPNLVAVVLYRLSRWLYIRGNSASARLVMWTNQLLTGAEMEPQAHVGAGLVLAHTPGILLGQQTRAGRDLFLHGGVVLGSVASGSAYGFPTLGDNVTIYTKASVLGSVKVGDSAVIGAHALVLKDVPAGMIARGVPAEVYPAANS